MESLQLSQVLADLSNLGAAVGSAPHQAFRKPISLLTSSTQEPEAAASIVSANVPVIKVDPESSTTSNVQSSPPRPSAMKRSWSSEPGVPPKFDKLGRRILINSSASRPVSAANSTPGTPRPGDSNVDDDWERASTLMALYDIRAKIKQQDNSSLLRAREKINALAAKQQAAERNMKASEELRRHRYSFPKPGL